MSEQPYIITSEDIKDIIRRYKSNTDLNIISELYGTSKKNIIKIISDYYEPIESKLNQQTHRNMTETKLAEMLKDWNSYMPVQKFVKKYGYSNKDSLYNALSWHRKQGKPFILRNGGVSKVLNYKKGVSE